jgi:multidrug efflux pump subunit AcrB
MGVLSRQAEALADRLRNVPGTEIVRLYGDVEEEVAVELDRREATQLGLSTRAVAERLARADARAPAGLLRSGGSELAVEVTGAFDDLQRIRRVPLGTGDGDAVTRLADLATVTRGWRQPVDEIALTDGTRAVYVGARMQADTRVDLWAQSARAAVDVARAAAGGAVELRTIFDQSVYTLDRLGTLTSNLLLGAGVVMVVVFFAMGWRAAAVVATALPLTAALSLFGVLVTGGALHQMSIFGMIIALGLLIDNAIVMTDEVRKRLHASHGREAALAGALRHLAVPLSASTFTTVLGFLPIVLLPGNAGDFVGWIGGAVILALIASLFVSLTVVAALAAQHLPSETPTGRFAWLAEGVSNRRWTAALRATLRTAFRRPALALAVAAIPSLTGFGLATQLGSEFFPPVDRDMADVKLWLPQHANIEATESAMRRVETVIREFDGVEHVHWLAGNSFPSVYYNLVMNRDDQPNYAQGVIHTASPEATERLVPEIQRAVDRAVPEVQVVLDKFGQGPPTEADVAYQLYGPDPDRLRHFGERVRAVLQNHPDVLHTRMTLPRGQPKLWLEADEAEAANAGFTLAELARQLDANLEGATGGEVIEDLTQLPVRVRYAPEVRRDLTQVAATDFVAGDGRFVPLASLGELALKPETPAIPRIDAERVNVIEGYPREGVLPIDVTNAVLDRLDSEGFELPPGYRLEVAGEAEESGEATANLAAFAPVIATLMVATLILVFRSLRIFAILSAAAGLSVGLGLAGTWAIDFPVSFNTILGTIGLVGLAFNNSIVVIAAIRANPAARACDPDQIAEEVLGTGRHLLSTTLTTIGGFMPLLLLTGGNFWPSLAVVLAGGVAGAMVLAIAFTPSLYVLLHRREMRRAAA